MRLCRWCGQEKPLTEFYKQQKNSKHLDIKITGKCKQCDIIATQYRNKKISPPNPIISRWFVPQLCQKCGTSTSEDFYYREKRFCKNCKKLSLKLRYSNSQEFRQYLEKYRKTNRKRMNEWEKSHRNNSLLVRLKDRFQNDVNTTLRKSMKLINKEDLEMLFYTRLFKLAYGNQLSLGEANQKINSFQKEPKLALLSLYQYHVKPHILGKF